jgi:hypothetical protein
LAQQVEHRPAALKPGGGLNDAKCKNGATISKDTVVPYIVDFTMVDIDNDGTIDANEFISGCKTVWSRHSRSSRA